MSPYVICTLFLIWVLNPYLFCIALVIRFIWRAYWKAEDLKRADAERKRRYADYQ